MDGADPTEAPGVVPEVARAFVERFVDPLFLVCGGEIRWIAPAVQQVLGWSPGELEGVRLADLVAHEDAGALDGLLARVAAGESGRGVFRFRGGEGSYLWVLVTMTPDAHALGATGAVGSIREINQRFEHERHLQLISEHTSDVVLTLDSARRITWVSSTLTSLTGTEPASAEGGTLADLVQPEDRALVHAVLDRAADRSEGGDDPSGEVRIRHSSAAPRWVRLRAERLGDSTQDEHELVVVLRDVDAFVQSRDSVRGEAERLESIINGMQDPHCLLAPVRDAGGAVIDFRLQDVNDLGCQSLGLPREALVGRMVTDLVANAAHLGLIEKYVAAMEAGAPVVLEDVRLPPAEPGGRDRRVDIRGIRVGDSLSLLWRDVTDRMAAADALAASEEKYRLLAENVADVVVLHEGRVVTWVSPSLREALGWAPAEWVGRRIDEFIEPVSRGDLVGAADGGPAGSVVVRRSRMLARDGSYHWVHAHSRPYVGPGGRIAGTVVSMHVIDKEVAAEADLERRARYDDLTGLLARNEVLARIAAQPELRRPPGERTAVLFCDLDRFKVVNDEYGHAAGDEVLRVVARRLRESLRIEDLAARVGGDEFLAVLHRVHDLTDAVGVADKIRRAASEPMDLPGGVSATITMSIGVTLAHEDESTDQLIGRADAAMYDAKAHGRDQVIAHSDDE